MELALNETSPNGLAGRGIEIKIRDFIARNLLYSETDYALGNDVSFLQCGIIDSLGVVELVAFAGQEFRIQIDPAEITPENFDSVDRMAAYIRRKLDPTPGGSRAG
jgi:acyl carrier protein